MNRSLFSASAIFLASFLLPACNKSQGNGVSRGLASHAGSTATDKMPDHRTIYALVTPTAEVKRYRSECEKKIDTEQPNLPEGNIKWEAIELCVQDRRMEGFCWHVYASMEETNGKYEAVRLCAEGVKKRYGTAEVTLVYEELYDKAASFVSPDCQPAASGSQPSNSSTKTREECLVRAKIETLCSLVSGPIADSKKRSEKMDLCKVQTPYLNPF